jgi:mannosyltransferase OCH1-like enzyme
MIPRLLHQIWIGDREPPRALMNEWKERAFTSPGGEYVLWSENSRKWTLQYLIDQVSELSGKADIMRYEILLAYGGIYIDADTRLLKPLDDRFLEPRVWACYESESRRPGLVANGHLGSLPGESLWDDLIKALPYRAVKGRHAWQATGPGFLTEIAAKHPEVFVFPARTFNPVHYDGFTLAPGDHPIFGRHLWGSHGSVYPNETGHPHIAVRKRTKPARRPA